MEAHPQTQEILEKLEKTNRRQVRWTQLQCLFSLIAALCCVAVLIAVVQVIPQVQQITGQVQSLAVQAETVLTNLETVTTDLAEADLAGMVNDIDSLVGSSQNGLNEALEKINALDIETLNQAIADLSAVIEPLASFFQAFK